MGYFEENGYNLTTGTQNIFDPLPPPMAYSFSSSSVIPSSSRSDPSTIPTKRTVRRRRFVRRPRRRMTSRRVRNIASRKKHDTQLGADSNADDSSNPVQLHAGNNYYLWAPSYLEQHEESYDYVRNNQNIYFRGVQDRVFLSAAFALYLAAGLFLLLRTVCPRLAFFR